MAETIGTITSEIYPCDSLNTVITTNAVSGVTRFQRFKVKVIVNKTTYDAAIVTDGKSGTFDTNFVNYGIHVSTTAPTATSSYNFDRYYDSVVTDSGTNYIIEYEFITDKNFVLFDPYYLIVNLRFLVNGATEDVYYQNKFYPNNVASGNLTSVGVYDTFPNVPEFVIAGTPDLKLIYDAGVGYDYHYVIVDDKVFTDTFTNTSFTFQSDPRVVHVADGDANIPVATSEQDSFQIAVIETLSAVAPPTLCLPGAQVDWVLAYNADNGNDQELNIIYTFPTLAAIDVASFSIEQVETIPGYGGSSTNFPSGSFDSTAWIPVPDDNTYETKYVINLVRTDGCEYTGEIVFILANEIAPDLITGSINLSL